MHQICGDCGTNKNCPTAPLPWMLTALTMFVPAVAWAQQPAINPHIDIEQEKLVIGHYPVHKVLESGRHLFSTPYTSEDGYGEGPTGPRMRRLGGGLYQEPRNGFRFLRLNGLDSQSCFECHNSIGSEVAADTISEALSRRPVGNAGPAGFASNAFINPDFPDEFIKFIRNPPHIFGTGYAQKLAEEMTLDLLWKKYKAISDARDKPFETQTAELTTEAMATINGSEFVPVDFGTYRVTYRPTPPAADSTERAAPSEEAQRDDERTSALRATAMTILGPQAEPKQVSDVLTRAMGGGLSPEELRKLIAFYRMNATAFDEDFTDVVGVSRDLVVRPFQWKGIASDERNFVKDALNFHFSIQAEELFFDVVEDEENGSVSVVVADHDQDEDGVRDEISVGNVSALTIFTMSVRPPHQVPGEQPSQVERGRQLFSGQAADVQEFFGAKVACSSCHIPTLRIRNPIVEVVNPLDPQADDELVFGKVSLSSQRASSADLPVMRLFDQLVREMVEENERRAPQVENGPPNSAFQKARAERARRSKAAADRLNERMNRDPADRTERDAAALTALEENEHPSFFFSLTSFGTPGGGEAQPGRLSYMYPRLEESADGMVDVPLFTDFKRHKMGSSLKDLDSQTTDVESIAVAPDEFLTRPLWGVADTGPWLHDGRALTLREAILLHQGSASENHDGTTSPPSEANACIDGFLRLTKEDQDAIVAFMLTLRLPGELPVRDETDAGSEGEQEARGGGTGGSSQ